MEGIWGVRRFAPRVGDWQGITSRSKRSGEALIALYAHVCEEGERSDACSGA